MNCVADIQIDETTRECSRCAYRFTNVRHDQRIVRNCDALDLSQRPKSDKRYLPLGDAVARVTRAAGIKKDGGCGGCDERREQLNRLIPNPFHAPPVASLLLEFHHGFGDAVQLTTVLLHLKNHHPDWAIDLVCKLGSHTLYHGLVRNVFPLGQKSPASRDYTHRRWLRWPETWETYHDSPATKAEFCLRHIFSITPEAALCRYHVSYGPEESRLAREYLERITGDEPSAVNHQETKTRRKHKAENADQSQAVHGHRYPVVLIHYQGNTARRRKNLGEDIVRGVVTVIRDRGLVPVILDWHTPPSSKLIDQQTVFCPDVHEPLWRSWGTGDGAGLAALIDHAALFIGIDSGPQKVAAGCLPAADSVESRAAADHESAAQTKHGLSSWFGMRSQTQLDTPSAGKHRTPAIGVWTKHHPLHFHALADNVVHLVPRHHERLIHGDVDVGLKYFSENYRHRVCTKHLRYELPELVDKMLEAHALC